MKFENGEQVFFLADNLLWRGFVEHEEEKVVTVKATYKTEGGRVYRTFNVTPKLVFRLSGEAIDFLYKSVNNPLALK